MIPLGTLSRMFSARVFTISAGGFADELLCAQASSINETSLARAAGFIGGGAVPTVFASAFTIFPRSKQPFIARSSGSSRRLRRPSARPSAAI
jgi:DHA2 family multidrug resistance protein